MRTKSATLLFLIFTFFVQANAQDPLDGYIKRLRQSAASGGSETGFLSVGSTFLYGQDYFEKKSYDMAAMYFEQAYQTDSTNAFVNYQLAASLLNQKNPYKATKAQSYWQKALQLNPDLRGRLATDFPSLFESPAPANNAPQKLTGLRAYIEALRYSQATGGSRTVMNSAGLDVLYGLGYYEKGDYDLAAVRLRQALSKDPSDTYAAYLMAVSLLAQNETAEGNRYMEKAINGDNTLKLSAEKDVAAAKKIFQQKQTSKLPAPSPANKPTFGGKLVYGTYACTQTVWRGAGANGGFASQPRGSFTLNSNGTYRWLDNGGSGRFRYDESTGNLTWLTGPLADKGAKENQFQPGKTYAQITVNFSKDYRWECGCKK